MSDTLHIKSFSSEQIRILLPSLAQNSNNPRFSLAQFEKYLSYDSGVSWVAICDGDDHIFALSCIEYQFEDNLSICFLSEIQTVIRGYGKELLTYILSQEDQDIVYLLVDPHADKSLLNWYKQFNLDEIKVPNSVYGGTSIFLYRVNGKIPERKINAFKQDIIDTFSD